MNITLACADTRDASLAQWYHAWLRLHAGHRVRVIYALPYPKCVCLDCTAMAEWTWHPENPPDRFPTFVIVVSGRLEGSPLAKRGEDAVGCGPTWT